MNAAYTHGQEVVVLDRHGNIELRGKVIGVHQADPWRYDILPDDHQSLKAMKPGIPHCQVRPLSTSLLAYQRHGSEPQHIKDEA